MIVDLLEPQRSEFSSFYCHSAFQVDKTVVHVLGADLTLHSLIKTHVTNIINLTSSVDFRDLYSSVPGYYVVILTSGSKTVIATDPYGIIKLFILHNPDVLQVSDDLYKLRPERSDLDREAVKFFLICGYTPSKHTFFHSISKLEPCTVYEYQGAKLTSERLYAKIGTTQLEGKEFLKSFFESVRAPLEFYAKHYDTGALFLSGGVDSSFLYQMLKSIGKADWADIRIGQATGLNQKHKIDNDFDLEYSQKLIQPDGRTVAVNSYDISAAKVLSDFIMLRDHLFTECAPAFTYMGLVRSVQANRTVINGQNADSILSFGSMGYPRVRDGALTGLQGFFSRYFFFFGESVRPTITYLAARLLRSLYYRRKYPEGVRTFSERTLLLGIGLQPTNEYYFKDDPTFAIVHEPNLLANWFERQYLAPLLENYKHLDFHSLAVLLYNKTYMQGSANRSTVLAAQIQNRSIYLPFTSLPLLELMANLKSSWEYAFYGKHPNLKVGREQLKLPNYIIERCDPNNSDSSGLLYHALRNNQAFESFMFTVFERTDWACYEEILSKPVLARLSDYKNGINLGDMPLIFKFLWLESLLQELPKQQVTSG
jgi:hypothetical protein